MSYHGASRSIHIASRPIYMALRSMIHVSNYGLSSYSTKTTSVANDQPALHQTGHLNQHQKEHQGRFGPCPHCRATFAQKSGLVKHVPRCSRQQGGVPEKEFVCEICSRKYSRKGELLRHMNNKHK